MKRFILPCVALIAGAWTTGGQAAGLFDDEKLSEGEVQAIERQSQLIGQTREALGVMRWLFLREEMQKGDCSPAIEIEGKAKSGDAESQWLLAGLHRRGLCVKQSAEETARWLEAASEQDYARAQFELGLAYGTGTGVQQNYVLAVQNFRSAAEGGVARAARRLGEMYRDGEGVPQDRQKAVSWFERGIAREHACERYCISPEEFLSWERSINKHGTRGLRATRMQDYRQPSPRADDSAR